MSEKALVFISCGQFTAAEKRLGKDVADLVDAQPGLRAYLAQNQSSVVGLTKDVFGALDTAAGFIAIMHHRGNVTTPDGHRSRASVWIEQEIAIAAFLRDVRGDTLKVACYMQRGIALEGVREKIILNPADFDTEADVLADLRTKLSTPEWRLLLKRPKVPRVNLDIGRAKLPASDGSHHYYETKIVMTNVSDVVIDDYLAVLWFPRQFILGDVPIQIEDREQASRTHRVFQHTNHTGKPLLPDQQRQILKIRYDMNDDLDSRYSHSKEFIEQIRVRVFIGGTVAGEASKPFKDAQGF